MKVENYQVRQVNAHLYQFYSKGVRGNIEMIITFIHLGDDNYNLGFGVWDRIQGDIDDSIETRNGDTDKILGTVAQTALNFLLHTPQANIYASGSCAARTRKYQMGINRYMLDLNKDYSIKGLVADKDCIGALRGAIPDWLGEWEGIRQGVNYDAFLLSLK